MTTTLQKPTIREQVSQLEKSLGQDSTRAAYASFKTKNGIKPKMSLSVRDMLTALQSASGNPPRPAPSSAPASAKPLQASTAARPSAPSTPAPAPEPVAQLHGRDLLRASIRDGLQRAKSGNAAAQSTRPAAVVTPPATPPPVALHGRDLLAAGIHSQIAKQKERGQLPRIVLKPA